MAAGILQKMPPDATPQMERARAGVTQKLITASQTDAKFRTVFDQGAYFAGVMNIDGTMVEANRMFLDGCGFSREDVIGKKYWDCGWWNRSPELMQLVREASATAASGAVFHCETVYFVADGSQRFVDLTIAPAKGDDGKILFLIPTGIDITGRRQNEEALRETARLSALRAGISNALIGDEGINSVLQHCAQALVHYMNAAFARIWLLNEKEQVLELCASAGLYTHLDGPHGRVKMGDFKIGRIAQNAKALLTNDVLHDPNVSDPAWAHREGMVAFAGYPMMVEGRVVGVMAMFARQSLSQAAFDELDPIAGNIAQWVDRKETEASFRQSEERFRNLADNMSQLAWMADATGAIFWYNKRWFDYTGTTLEEMQGWGWGQIQHPEYLERVFQKWRVHLQKGENWEDTFPLMGKDHRYRWFLSRAYPIRDDRGNVVRWFGTNTDISELREAENALKEVQETLARQNRELDQTVQIRTAELLKTITELEAFSYSMSHDMRAPLRAMHGYSQILLDDYHEKLEPEALLYLQRINRGAARLDVLIQEVLAYNKVARGDIQLASINLEQLIADVVENYPDLNAAHIQLTVAPIPLVLGHEGLLTQVVSNLLGNAVKFAKAGVPPRVDVSAERVGSNVRIVFQDQGIGIAAEHHERIFKIFGRVYPEKQYEGTGIGLAIVAKAAERMGGSVEVRSELGQGSQFLIQLQAAS